VSPLLAKRARSRRPVRRWSIGLFGNEIKLVSDLEQGLDNLLAFGEKVILRVFSRACQLGLKTLNVVNTSHCEAPLL
jgi:hypothetical protein